MKSNNRRTSESERNEKQDYIVRSCIYNHVCVVGKKETIEIIRSEMKEMSLVLEDVAKDLKSEKPVISEPVLDSMTERYLAFWKQHYGC